RGAEDLKKVCQNKINAQQFHRNGDGSLSWEEVECQGACVNAPMVMIGRDTYEDLTPERLEEIIDAFEAGKGETITPGPQIDRHFSAPVGGPLTLLDDVVAKAAKSAPAKKKKAPAAKASKPKPANPTMKLAETASKAKNATIKPASKAKNADTITNRLMTVDEDNLPKKSAGKPAKTVKTRPGAQGADPGSVLENVKGATAVKPKATKSAAKVTGGNPTMKIAATATGRAAKKEEPQSSSAADRPEAVSKPANPDDLKMVAGIGPKIEGILHELGIWRWAQIAAWTDNERDWVNGYLRFKGRIEREDWVNQAAALAKGGRDEYVRVFGKEPR
ncbi:MAG: NAD(P)H-dependent oxidoreductase subunit E, partial [Pseudomonadota bacterium]